MDECACVIMCVRSGLVSEGLCPGVCTGGGGEAVQVRDPLPNLELIKAQLCARPAAPPHLFP